MTEDEAYLAAAKAAGCPPEQMRNFERAGILLQPRQLAASAAARLCDRPGGPTAVGYGGARGGGKSHWLLAQMGADDCQRIPGLKCLLLRKVGKANMEHFEDLRRRLFGELKHEFSAYRGVLTFGNGSPSIRFAQVRELLQRVQAAQDGQIADLVAGDFNCAPDSPLYQELPQALGRSAQELSGGSPFVPWDGLSTQAGAGETFDHIFVHKRTPFQSVRASSRVAFAAAKREDRLSDHFGIEAVLSLSADSRLAGTISPIIDNTGALNVMSDKETHAAGDYKLCCPS